MKRSSMLAFVALSAACVYALAAEGRSSNASSDAVAVETHESPADRSIQFWQARINAEGWKHYFPGWMELGKAHFRKAKETHDPHELHLARAAEKQSIAIQETFEADVAMMQIQDYSHQFVDALAWANKAMDASTNGWNIPDPSIVSSMVEAYIGLGQLDKARALLPKDGTVPNRFYTAAAWAQYLNAAGQHEEAAKMFGTASVLAKKEGSEEMSQWARVAAAGALLDGGAVEDARRELNAIPGHSAFLSMHQAELAMMDKRYSDALGIYEQTLAQNDDPEVERLAFVAALKAGNESAKQRHFDAAEKGFKTAIDAGEIYYLGALAQLYLDAGVHLNKARKLAADNLQYKRDAAAMATYHAAFHP